MVRTVTFPAPEWSDAGLVDPSPHNPPIPSATVEVTNDRLGVPTQVLSIPNALAPSQGIYRSNPVAPNYLVSVDVRIDRFSDSPEAVGADCVPVASGDGWQTPPSLIWRRWGDPEDSGRDRG